MDYTKTQSGNLLLTFESPINIERSYSPKMERLRDKVESTMELLTNDNGTPEMIEWDIEELERTEQIGLWFDGKTLIDYDGVFELPQQAIKLIRKSGYKVPKHFQ